MLVKTEKGICRIDPEMPRGAYIPPEEIEEALGIDRKEPQYSFTMMAMIGEFWRATCEAGDPKMACIKKGGVLVMTDADAAGYGNCGFWDRVTAATRLHARTQKAVRETELTPEQLAEHREAATRRGVLVGGIETALQAEGLHEMRRAASLRAFDAAPGFDPFEDKE